MYVSARSGIQPSRMPRARKPMPSVRRPSRGDPGALAAEDGAARRVHRLGRVHGEALVGRELARVAAQSVLRRDGLRGVLQLGPGARRGTPSSARTSLRYSRESGVRDVRDRVQPSVVRRRVHDRRQEAGQREAVAGQRADPAGRRELGGPVDVDVQHVEPAPVAAAQVGRHLRVGLVGGVRQLDQGDPLAGMGAVPALEQRAEVAGEVAGGGQGERAAAVAGGLVGAGAGGDVPGHDHDENEQAPTGGAYPPHRFLPVHRHHGHPRPGTEAMYTG